MDGPACNPSVRQQILSVSNSPLTEKFVEQGLQNEQNDVGICETAVVMSTVGNVKEGKNEHES